jgi:hypothetical protein
VYRAGGSDLPYVAIRGLSDIVGLSRDPAWTAYACHTAAAFTLAFIRAQPIVPRALAPASSPISGPTAPFDNSTVLALAHSVGDLRGRIRLHPGPKNENADEKVQVSAAGATIVVKVGALRSMNELASAFDALQHHAIMIDRLGFAIRHYESERGVLDPASAFDLQKKRNEIVQSWTDLRTALELFL